MSSRAVLTTLALALGGVACGGGGAGPDGGGPTPDAAAPAGSCLPRAGSRLAPEGYELEGGERVSTGWWDGVRGEACGFELDPAEVLRCFPRRTSAQTYGEYFLDAACTESVHLLPPPDCEATPVAYVAEEIYGACSAGLVLSPVVELIDTGGNRGVYVVDTTGACAFAGNVTTERLARVGPRILSTEFVAATFEVGEARGRFAPLVLQAEDGAEDACPNADFGRLHDVALDVTCGLAKTSDGATRCVPEGTDLTGGFADTGCVSPAAFVQPTCAVPAYARREAAVTCGSGLELMSVDEPLTTLYVFDGLFCQASLPGTEAGYYAVSAPVDPGTFEKLTQAATERTGRLAPQIWTAPDGAELATGRFADGPLGGQVCAIGLAADGILRCLPADVGYGVIEVGVFSDAGCTTPIAYTQLDRTCAPDLTYVTMDVAEPDACGSRRQAYQVGAEIAAAYSMSETGCTLAFLPDERILRMQVELAPPDRFVRATPTRW